eukprot:XP_013984694.1 PREDICTED: glycine-rich protein DOT1-like [Salmo salar]
MGLKGKGGGKWGFRGEVRGDSGRMWGGLRGEVEGLRGEMGETQGEVVGGSGGGGGPQGGDGGDSGGGGRGEVGGLRGEVAVAHGGVGECRGLRDLEEDKSQRGLEACGLSFSTGQTWEGEAGYVWQDSLVS